MKIDLVTSVEQASGQPELVGMIPRSHEDYFQFVCLYKAIFFTQDFDFFCGLLESENIIRTAHQPQTDRALYGNPSSYRLLSELEIQQSSFLYVKLS
jgi:hypothetical protein